jgi:hypothetical protein
LCPLRIWNEAEIGDSNLHFKYNLAFGAKRINQSKDSEVNTVSKAADFLQIEEIIPDNKLLDKTNLTNQRTFQI